MIKIRIQEKTIDPNTFIGGWYIDKPLCEELIHYYKYNKKYANEGKVAMGVNTDWKQSHDLAISPGNYDCVIGLYRQVLQSILMKYIEKFPMSGNGELFNIEENYNIQHYPIGGGFKKWHYENSGHIKQYHRHLVFMTYLNDVEGGGTEYLYQKIPQKDAEQGLTMIWPTYWTHTHRGIISDKQEKYILTGWYNFIEAKKLGENR